MMKQERSFEEWVKILPKKLKQIIFENGTRPYLMQINYVVVSNMLKNQDHLNPTTEEIIHWIEIGKIIEFKKLKKAKKYETEEKYYIPIYLRPQLITI